MKRKPGCGEDDAGERRVEAGASGRTCEDPRPRHAVAGLACAVCAPVRLCAML